MKKKLSFPNAAFVYMLVSVLFIIFLGYIVCCEKNDIYRTREDASYKAIQDVKVREYTDSTAPMGIRREYRFRLDEEEFNGASLIFYAVHQLAEVRLDEELIYCLSLDENNRIGNSPSSNWVIIPLYPSDRGKEIAVTVTPVYEAVRNREIQLYVGSKTAFFKHQLNKDLPQIILSLICILMGVLLVAEHISRVIYKKVSSGRLWLLGVFSALLGIWRITDTRCSSILFEQNAMSLGYITISALFLMPIPLLLYLEDRFKPKYHLLVRIAALLTCVLDLGILILQITGAADLREVLSVCHVSLIVNSGILILLTLLSGVKESERRKTAVFLGLLSAGVIWDIICFYVSKTSASIIVTQIVFVIYTIGQFAENIIVISRKANLDGNTGLFNRAYWEEFVKNDISSEESIGMMMLDLNGLKHVNDTWGHEFGDKMIADFANILHKIVGSTELVCRWGGDEFTVLIRNADHQKMRNYISDIRKAVEDHNDSGEEPKIFYACGYALSGDYPMLTRQELLSKADEAMYRDKQKWYDKNTNQRHGE